MPSRSDRSSSSPSAAIVGIQDLLPESVVKACQARQYRNSSFDFVACMEFLIRAGKASFGNHFRIAVEDLDVFFKLLVYFYRDGSLADALGISPEKGLLVTGPIGCGKTSIMTLMRFFLGYQYPVIPTRNIRLEFIQYGFRVIDKYSRNSFHSVQGIIRPRPYCFDDLGLESNIKYYGNDTNVMAEILLGRHRLFVRQQMITHATTNLTAVELESIYGNRVRSRMREMFNLVAFPESATDKRL